LKNVVSATLTVYVEYYVIGTEKYANRSCHFRNLYSFHVETIKQEITAQRWNAWQSA